MNLLQGDCVEGRDGFWMCKCRPEWRGDGCEVELETQCNDGRDNDRGKTIVLLLVVEVNVFVISMF